jgi:hypothetical protein
MKRVMLIAAALNQSDIAQSFTRWPGILCPFDPHDKGAECERKVLV